MFVHIQIVLQISIFSMFDLNHRPKKNVESISSTYPLFQVGCPKSRMIPGSLRWWPTRSWTATRFLACLVEGVLLQGILWWLLSSSRWWFQIFFIFTRFPIWLIFFRWVETTSQSWRNKTFFWTAHVLENSLDLPRYFFSWFLLTLSCFFCGVFFSNSLADPVSFGLRQSSDMNL